jgi:hypothetical protein
LVEQLLDDQAAGGISPTGTSVDNQPRVVFDPFSGSGTTALCAAYRGATGIATDINPFLVWLANAKAARYEPPVIEEFVESARPAAQSAASGKGALVECPPLSNIERWWRPAALSYLRRLKAAIDTCELEAPAPVATLLNVAFCRTMMRLSNAAFNHQSMSFKTAAATRRDATCATDFLEDVAQVAAGAADNPSGTAEYHVANARSGPSQWRNRVDLLITSPPYPNRMSYIRELRPYMYWMRFLSTGRQAGELDWEAIGGTWGVATSRLAQWSACHPVLPELRRVLVKIRSAHLKNGPLLANYVQKYFEDMLGHLEAMVPLLRAGATAHYIVGNSIFYGHEVRAQEFLAQQMAQAGLCDVRIIPLRKRNSKQGLFEFHVSGKCGR